MIYFGNKVGHFGSGGVYTCYLTKQATKEWFDVVI
jgi:hypothetical protein